MKFICYVFLLVFIFSIGHLNTVLANGDEENHDHYEALGVKPTASFGDIRKAYKTEVIRWHPDKNSNNVCEANERMKLINAAHDVLGNSEKRDHYDSQRRHNALIKAFTECLKGPMVLLDIFSCRK